MQKKIYKYQSYDSTVLAPWSDSKLVMSVRIACYLDFF